jgi:hypothetical protein
MKPTEIRKAIFVKIIDLGFPTAMQMLFEVGVFTAAIWLAGTMGVVDQAANQIALNLSSMTFMIAVGLSYRDNPGGKSERPEEVRRIEADKPFHIFAGLHH